MYFNAIENDKMNFNIAGEHPCQQHGLFFRTSTGKIFDEYSYYLHFKSTGNLMNSPNL